MCSLKYMYVKKKKKKGDYSHCSHLSGDTPWCHQQNLPHYSGQCHLKCLIIVQETVVVPRVGVKYSTCT